MKIYPTPLIDLPKPEVGIEHMSITYCQPIDEGQKGDEEFDMQRITIATQISGDCISSKEITDGKAEDGFYLTIRTNRWAIDSEEEISELIRDFKQRLHLNIPKKGDAT